MLRWSRLLFFKGRVEDEIVWTTGVWEEEKLRIQILKMRSGSLYIVVPAGSVVADPSLQCEVEARQTKS